MREAKLRETLKRREDLVTTFPEWMLGSDDIRRASSARRGAIIEMAGRDSVAAALKGAAETPYDVFVPTIAFTGAEFGDWQAPFDAVAALREGLRGQRPDLELLNPVILGATAFWRLLNGGQGNDDAVRRYGFFTPCVGCHLYLHALRVPLARLLGITAVIAGERERHERRVKLNQTPGVLDVFVDFMASFGVELVLPLRLIAEDNEVERLTGPDWKEGQKQLLCPWSGRRDGGDAEKGRALALYLVRNAVPAATQVINDYLSGRTPDFELARRLSNADEH